MALRFYAWIAPDGEEWWDVRITRSSLSYHRYSCHGTQCDGSYVSKRNGTKLGNFINPSLKLQREMVMAMMLSLRRLPEELMWKVLCMLYINMTIVIRDQPRDEKIDHFDEN